MEYQSEFYITLPSDSEKGNKTGNFTVQLPRSLHLTDAWEVALTDLTYPRTFSSFPKKLEQSNNQTTTVHVYLEVGMLLFFDVPHGNYSNVFQLVKAINECLKKKLSEFSSYTQANKARNELIRMLEQKWGEKLSKNLKFSCKPYTTRVSLDFNSTLIEAVELSQHLAHMLGFESQYINKFHTVENNAWYSEKARYLPNLHVGCESIYIYTDIVEPQLIGSTYAQLLKIVNVEGDFGQNIHTVFYNRHYMPLCAETFQSIHIDIKNSLGEHTEFDSGKCILNLHFRRQNGL